LVTGQRSVREKEWLETLGIFGIGKEDGKRIIGRLGLTLLDEHEKLFGSYLWHTFGPLKGACGPLTGDTPRIGTKGQIGF
jgi:hypothetical protein